MRDRHRYALLTAAAGSGAAIFVTFTFYEKPGLGLGHFYYVAIILAALATGPAVGAAAAGAATVLFALGVILNPDIPPSEVLSTSTGIRFVTYQPFALAVGGVDDVASTIGRRAVNADDMLREIASRLLHSLPPGDEVARIGEESFAVLTYAGSASEAGKIAVQLQRLLAAEGLAVTFGWAAYPQDGANALSLYRAADERLYARRVIHRQEAVVSLPSPAASA
ncbi:MAG: diguanylate cyclase [Actinobacteria bacterium]|nr:MAG: diguanylate cyclase [Actinomycetota bacterium]